jgi:hypothetical protein
MSIEDINYLKKNCIKQSYTFLIDSKDRNRRVHPEPSEYSIEFTTPFKNVIGVEIIDVSVPKTMCNIDTNNNRLYYYIASDEDNNKVPIIIDNEGKEIYNLLHFSYIDVPIGDYTTNTFINKLRTILQGKGIDLDIIAVDTPAELTNLIYFKSSKPFILDMNQSTISEALGFDTYTTPKDSAKYKYNTEYNNKIGFEKLYHSIYEENTGRNVVYSPGMMYLLGIKYLLVRCPEIEQHLYRSLAYTKYTTGLAKIRINSYGYNDEKTSFLKVPTREFHPIGKLSKITLRFETETGALYNFKGVNHNLVFAIYYYEPKQDNIVRESILNPDYNPNILNYLYKQEEQEGESDEEDEDFSRDNIDVYKKRELQYNHQGIENRNKMIAHQYSKDNIRNNFSKRFTIKDDDKNDDEYETDDSGT